jgi:hypothetical protein
MSARRFSRVRTVVSGAVVLLGLAVLAPPGASAQTSKPPVISLKAFTSVSEWVLDITWNAKDTHEDEDFSAGMELTATARYYLKRLDQQDGWGRWETRSEQSSNFTFTSFLVDKRNGQRLDYRSTSGPLMATAANLQVGVSTPGYQLVVEAMFQLKATQSVSGALDSALHLGTTELGQPPTFCTGPLPQSGTTIHGSRVILADVPPFGSSNLPRTRVGIQYVLQPLAELAPLVPPKKAPH